MSRDRPHSTPSWLGALEADQMRRGLTIFFAANGCGDRADSLPDEVLQMAEARLGDPKQAVETGKESLPDVHAVARTVLKAALEERGTNPEAAQKSAWEMRQMLIPDSAAGDSRQDGLAEEQPRCLDDCLAAMTETRRALILEYHRPTEPEKKRNRQVLAEELGVSPDELQSRMFKIRSELQACLKGCSGEEPGPVERSRTEAR